MDTTEQTGPRYSPVSMIGTPTYTCMDCGSVVLDRVRHDEWHHNLADGVAAIVLEAVTDFARRAG